MTTLAIKKSDGKILMELDRNALETIMAAMGVLTHSTLESVRKAEEDYRNGHYRVLKNPKELLKKTAEK